MARIVVMDDDAAVRDTVEAALKRDGHEVQVFEDAAPALDEVDFDEVDLVVSDLVMPTPGDQFMLVLQYDGIEVPVVIISANLNEERVDYLKELGAKAVLEKPFEIKELLDIVKAALP
ncbi:MAG: response regulator [bacterium]|nr:response regulator [bacterium]